MGDDLYLQLALRKDIMDEADDFLASCGFGYRSRAEFVVAAIRFHMNLHWQLMAAIAWAERMHGKGDPLDALRQAIREQRHLMFPRPTAEVGPK